MKFGVIKKGRSEGQFCLNNYSAIDTHCKSFGDEKNQKADFLNLEGLPDKGIFDLYGLRKKVPGKGYFDQLLEALKRPLQPTTHHLLHLYIGH